MWAALYFMIARAKKGNISAFKTLFDVMGEANQIESNESEIRLAYIARMDPPEEPPEFIGEEYAE